MWIIPITGTPTLYIVWIIPIPGTPTLHIDANKSGKAGYKLENFSKVDQSPYSVPKSELYIILMALRNFKEPLNIVTDLQYAERAVLRIETTDFIPDDRELTLLFIQLQDSIRNRNHPICNHMGSHLIPCGLPSLLAQVMQN